MPNGNGQCVTGRNPYGHCGAAASCPEPYSCCAACPEDCNSRCGWAQMKTDKEGGNE